jgi:hypothetical protein
LFCSISFDIILILKSSTVWKIFSASFLSQVFNVSQVLISLSVALKLGLLFAESMIAWVIHLL